MKIYSFTNIIAFPFIIAFAVILYMTGDYRYEYMSYWMIPLVVIMTTLYLFKPQIDFWWYSRHPSGLDQPIIDWLEKHSGFYVGLDDNEKLKFRNRLSIFIRAKSFKMMVGPEQTDMPEDLKAIIAHCAIIVSFSKSDFLFEPYEHFILYQHPFPSPDHPYIHSVEWNAEDGVIIWSLEQLIAGILNDEDYNIGLHPFVEIQMKDSTNNLSKNNILQSQKIKETIGLSEINWTTVTKVLEIDIKTIVKA